METGINKVFLTNKDRISALPEHVIHEILNRLTLQDIARTSCLSKAWKTFSVSIPFLNIDHQEFNRIPYDGFKKFMYHKVKCMSTIEERLDIHKFRLRMHHIYVREATKEIEECMRLISKVNTIKEFDFQIMYAHNDTFKVSNYSWHKLFHHIYNAKTLVTLRISGLTVTQPSDWDIKFSYLEILRLENVTVDRESIIDWVFTGCPLIREIALINCDGLEHLNVRGNLGNLKVLEVSFCPRLESVETQVPSLEKLVLSEIKRNREDEFCMALSIDWETSENLRELTLCNSSIQGLTFTRLFSRCSNVESLVLDRCINFFKISIESHKLRKLVITKCFDLVVTNIEAPNLTSFIFCLYLLQGCYDDSQNPEIKYCEKIGQLQECMLDFNQVLRSKSIWISLWFDKFKNFAGQKMIFYLKDNWHHVVVLEDWSSMAEIALMSQISEVARRIIVTTMSFDDLADYVFGDNGKGMKRVMAISFTKKSRLYEVLKNKTKLSCDDRSYLVLTKEEVSGFSSSICWPSFSRISATLKAASFSITRKLKFQGDRLCS